MVHVLIFLCDFNSLICNDYDKDFLNCFYVNLTMYNAYGKN